MNAITNQQMFGVIITIVASMVLALLLQTAYKDIKKTAYTTKYSCFGQCASEPSEDIKALINYTELNEQNIKRRISAEIVRSKEI